MHNIISLPNFGDDLSFVIDSYVEYMTEVDDLDEDGVEGIENSIDNDATFYNLGKMMVDDSYHGYEMEMKRDFPSIVKSVEFKEIDRPREYNFRGDELIAAVEYNLDALIGALDGDGEFASWLKENHSSRDGYVSFVETDVKSFFDELREEAKKSGFSRNLTVAFQFLCRNEEIKNALDFDGKFEAIAFK